MQRTCIVYVCAIIVSDFVNLLCDDVYKLPYVHGYFLSLTRLTCCTSYIICVVKYPLTQYVSVTSWKP